MSKTYVTTIFFVLLITPFVVSADSSIELFQGSIPFLGDATDISIEGYVNALYQAAISIAAILVVIKLILAGVKYMFSEIVTDKQKAKDDIRGAFFGLLIILGAVTILNLINPNLTQLDFLERATRVEVDSTDSGITIGGRDWSDVDTDTLPWTVNVEGRGDLDRAQRECREAEGTLRTSGFGESRTATCE